MAAATAVGGTTVGGLLLNNDLGPLGTLLPKG